MAREIGLENRVRGEKKVRKGLEFPTGKPKRVSREVPFCPRKIPFDSEKHLFEWPGRERISVGGGLPRDPVPGRCSGFSTFLIFSGFSTFSRFFDFLRFFPHSQNFHFLKIFDFFRIFTFSNFDPTQLVPWKKNIDMH